MISVSALILSMFVTLVLIPIFSRLALRIGAIDMPAPRKVHLLPVPRIGGAAMALGAFLPIILWARADDFVRAYLAGSGILIVFGLADDLKSLNYKLKFLGQLGAALVIIIYGGVKITYLGSLLPDDMVLMNWSAVALTLIVIVGVTNAINLADGLDGLAGGISLLGFCCIAYLAYLMESQEVFLIALCLSGTIFGFLRFNTYPASIFMGDSGSQLLGFTAVVLSIKVTQEHTALSPVLPLIILGFPILDTLTVMAERIGGGRSPFSSDKNHFHHRLIALGFFHTEAVFIIYFIQSLMVMAAMAFRFYFVWPLLAGYTVFSIAIISIFAAADRSGFRVPRYRLIDKIIKGKLQNMRTAKLHLRISFEATKLLLPSLLFFACLLPAQIPGFASLMSLFLSVLLVSVWIFWKKLMAFVLRFIIFLVTPLVLYLGETGRLAGISPKLLMGYHLAFFVLTFFIILSVKYSRRLQGFRITTMDYLIIFIAVVVPNLPGQVIPVPYLGALAVKLIVLLFGYEVLITELRGQFDALVTSTLAVLAIIGIRGII